jgi:NhaP-type Na+/H+ or K+/H+ antiporter
MAEAAGKYGENAPMAAVCCNACRTCVTSNVLAVVTAGITGAGFAVTNRVRRRFEKSS